MHVEPIDSGLPDGVNLGGSDRMGMETRGVEVRPIAQKPDGINITQPAGASTYRIIDRKAPGLLI